MANITISQINSSAQNIHEGDLLLVSKKNQDGSYTSKKLDASKLLASCRELNYNDERCNVSRMNDLFKKDGQVLPTIVNNTLTTSEYLKYYTLDEWTIPYSGLLVTNFLIRLDNSIQLENSEKFNMTLSVGTIQTSLGTIGNGIGVSVMHWHSDYEIDSSSYLYFGGDCQSQTTFVTKGDIVRICINEMTTNMKAYGVNRCCIVPFKYS